MLELLLHKKLSDCSWPTYNPQFAVRETKTIAIQVNGRTRSSVKVGHDSSQDEITRMAQQEAAPWLDKKEIVKTIIVKDRLINFVIK